MSYEIKTKIQYNKILFLRYLSLIAIQYKTLIIWKKIEQSVGLADNCRMHRLNLTSYQRKDSESIDEFYTRCGGQGLNRQFKNMDDR